MWAPASSTVSRNIEPRFGLWTLPAGFLELGEIVSLAHTTETLLNQVREGRQALEGEAFDVTFESTARLRQLLEALQRVGGEVGAAQLGGELGRLVLERAGERVAGAGRLEGLDELLERARVVRVGLDHGGAQGFEQVGGCPCGHRLPPRA